VARIVGEFSANCHTALRADEISPGATPGEGATIRYDQLDGKAGAPWVRSSIRKQGDSKSHVGETQSEKSVAAGHTMIVVEVDSYFRSSMLDSLRSTVRS
jgi:hypothetical protein